MPPKVLIVDDEPLIRLLYERHLAGAGYQLLTAEDGAEVQDLALRESPCVIVMDVQMSKLDGLAALRALKKHEATRTIPVIIITALLASHQATRDEALHSGAALFMSKPFSPAQLLKAIAGVCSTPGSPGVPA